MDVGELLKENVLRGIWDEEEQTWCVVIPVRIFLRLLRLIPRDVDEED
ncbi:unnamed protein product [marine sediment metagenome]|uniref:Uncharacterized protein n=1 Tax=marine sediment metagenome TaxID=412755 RepID=X0UTQ9_9ZZZZ